MSSSEEADRLMQPLFDRLRTIMADSTERFHDIIRPGVICGHCGEQMRGAASIGDVPVCHPSWDGPDCYRLVTVYGEALGSRRS